MGVVKCEHRFLSLGVLRTSKIILTKNFDINSRTAAVFCIFRVHVFRHYYMLPIVKGIGVFWNVT